MPFFISICTWVIIDTKVNEIMCDDTMELPFELHENKTVLPSFWLYISWLGWDLSTYVSTCHSISDITGSFPRSSLLAQSSLTKVSYTSKATLKTLALCGSRWPGWGPEVANMRPFAKMSEIISIWLLRPVGGLHIPKPLAAHRGRDH